MVGRGTVSRAGRSTMADIKSWKQISREARRRTPGAKYCTKIILKPNDRGRDLLALCIILLIWTISLIRTQMQNKFSWTKVFRIMEVLLYSGGSS